MRIEKLPINAAGGASDRWITRIHLHLAVGRVRQPATLKLPLPQLSVPLTAWVVLLIGDTLIARARILSDSVKRL